MKLRTLSSTVASLAIGILIPLSAHAKKLVIMTDEPSGAKAIEIQKLIQMTPPFNLLRKTELSIVVKILDSTTPAIACQPKTIKYTDEEIYSLQYYAKLSGVTLSPEDLKKYRQGYTIDRLVDCDDTQISAVGMQVQADQILFVHQSEYEGGSGGTIPVILSGSREGIGLHEWLHTFGLADEYAYPQGEAPFYCEKTDWVNIAIFKDQPPYQGGEDVRTRHQAQIQWLPYLSKTALLTTGDQLGSPVGGNLGIFKAQTCSALEPGIKSWKPSAYTTIMENPQTNYIPKPYWPAILSGLGVSQSRIDSLMTTTVQPQWLKNYELSPGNPPPSGI